MWLFFSSIFSNHIKIKTSIQEDRELNGRRKCIFYQCLGCLLRHFYQCLGVSSSSLLSMPGGVFSVTFINAWGCLLRHFYQCLGCLLRHFYQCLGCLLRHFYQYLGVSSPSLLSMPGVVFSVTLVSQMPSELPPCSSTRRVAGRL